MFPHQGKGSHSREELEASFRHSSRVNHWDYLSGAVKLVIFTFIRTCYVLRSGTFASCVPHTPHGIAMMEQSGPRDNPADGSNETHMDALHHKTPQKEYWTGAPLFMNLSRFLPFLSSSINIVIESPKCKQSIIIIITMPRTQSQKCD